MDNILATPLFYLFIAFTFLLSFGYFRGRRRNKEIYQSAFKALVDIVKPNDQTFTVIGGVVGYHANFYMPKQHPLSQIDATITLLPRHSWLYLPISYLTRRFDRLFITLNCRAPLPPGEGHLIESSYARFRGAGITNEEKLQKEKLDWGNHRFYLYYDDKKTRDLLLSFVAENPDPGLIRHMALVPDKKRGFVFMIPRIGQVQDSFAPLYRWFLSTLKKEERELHRKNGKIEA